AGRSLFRSDRYGAGGVTRWLADAVNLWTVGYADSRLTAQARSPMDKLGKTHGVSPSLPTGRRLPTSFTAPQQKQGLNLIPGKVKPSAGNQPWLILPGTCPHDRDRRHTLGRVRSACN